MLAAIEQFNRLSSRFTLEGEVGAWWLARLVVEFGVGAAAIGLFRLTDAAFADELLGWIVAGSAGPAIVRFRFIDFGVGQDSRPVGLATLYEPLRAFIEGQLDDASANKQSEWVNEMLLPTLEAKNVKAHDLGQQLNDYYAGLERLSTTDRIGEQQFVSDTLSGEGSEAVKRETLVRRAIEVDSYRVLRRLQKRGRQVRPSRGESS